MESVKFITFCDRFQMHRLRHLRSIVACGIIQRQSCETILDTIRCGISRELRTLSVTACAEGKPTAKPLRSTKPKSKNNTQQHFVDIKPVRALFRFIEILSIVNVRSFFR